MYRAPHRADQAILPALAWVGRLVGPSDPSRIAPAGRYKMVLAAPDLLRHVGFGMTSACSLLSGLEDKRPGQIEEEELELDAVWILEVEHGSRVDLPNE